MGNLLTFLELAAAALWFGGAATGGATAGRLRPLFYGCAVTLAAVSLSRGMLWNWTPLHTTWMLMALAAAVATRWWARVPGMVFGLLCLAWVAWRGY
jgi:hypothetical protein